MIGHAYGKSAHIRGETGKYMCPYCYRNYSDGHRYEKRIHRNKSGVSRRICVCCCQWFGIADDMVRGIVGFKL